MVVVRGVSIAEQKEQEGSPGGWRSVAAGKSTGEAAMTDEAKRSEGIEGESVALTRRPPGGGSNRPGELTVWQQGLTRSAARTKDGHAVSAAAPALPRRATRE